MPTPTDVQTPDQKAARRLAVLEHIRVDHPDIWAMSLEVDESLLAYLEGMTATERLVSSRNFARLWEVGRGASQGS